MFVFVVSFRFHVFLTTAFSLLKLRIHSSRALAIVAKEFYQLSAAHNVSEVDVRRFHEEDLAEARELERMTNSRKSASGTGVVWCGSFVLFPFACAFAFQFFFYV